MHSSFTMKSLSLFIYFGLALAVVNSELDSGYINVKKTHTNTQINKTDNGTTTPFLSGGINLCNETSKIVESLEELDGAFEEPSQYDKKRCRQNYTKCMERDLEYEDTLGRLSQKLFGFKPPFDLSKIEGISEKCKKTSHKYMEALNKYKLWALQIYDATAKLPSGILSGNINQFGDFDLCLAARENENGIYGKYCLASIQIESPKSSYLAGLHSLIHSHFPFRSNLDDPGHRVPRFSSINWGFCMPDSCSPKDLEIGLKHLLDNTFSETNIEYKLKIDREMCQTSKEHKIPASALFVSAFFLLMIGIVLGASIYDMMTLSEKNEYIMAFSLKKNMTSMFSMKRSPTDLEAVHGIRCLNAIMLLFAHKSMALFFVPYTNRTAMSETLGKPWTVLGRAASLYTDPFIMLSGTLTTYSLLGRLQRTGRINFLHEYTSRLFRIVPTFGALILFCTFVLPYLSSGPLWNLVVTHHSNICKQHWWRNMLFIHNYFGFKDMCLTHTHHVGIDTQLFLISPFLVLILWKWPKVGSIGLAFTAIASTVMRYYATYTRHLSNYVHFGTSVQQLFDTADHMYILPPHRITVYIMGIFLAYLLKRYNGISLKPAHIHIGNMLALVCFCTSFFGPAFMGDMDYVYNPTDAAMYAALAPILWCFSFAWIIFTTHLGYKGIIGKAFSQPIFLLWTKVSYTVYLTQFPIFFFNVGNTREAKHYGFFTMMGNLQEYSWIMVTSGALTLIFETPFQNIRNILFKEGPAKKIKQKLT